MMAELITLFFATALLWFSCQREQKQPCHLDVATDTHYRAIRDSLDRLIAEESARLAIRKPSAGQPQDNA